MRFAAGRRSPIDIAKQFASPVLLAVSIGILLGGCSMLRHGHDGSQGFSVLRHGGEGSQRFSVLRHGGDGSQGGGLLRHSRAAAQLAQAPAPAQPAVAASPAIEKIPFRVGVSTATVERLAKQQSCTGGQGAGLITPVGPVEVYRMQCDSGRTFLARCELRQCRAM